VHGRFSGFGATVNWIAADILRIQDGILVEHWDVIQDEATKEQSKVKRQCLVAHFQNRISGPLERSFDLKNRVLVGKYFLPGNLERQI
jgi:hypothetical protein